MLSFGICSTNLQVTTRQYLKARTRNLANKAQVRWYTSCGANPISRPINLDPLNIPQAGDIYLHRLICHCDSNKTRVQIWVWKKFGGRKRGFSWHAVRLLSEETCPTDDSLVLSFAPSGDPTWVVPNTRRRHNALPEVLYPAESSSR